MTRGEGPDTTLRDAYPPLVAFMPHRPPMLMLDAMRSHDDDGCVCTKTFRAGDPLVEGERVSSLVAIELFAQTAAAHFGYVGFLGGGARTSGALLGTRKIDLHVGHFTLGAEIVIRVKQVFVIPPAAQFECTAEIDGVRVAEGTINVAMGQPPSAA
jgi:predicted hotdog family 3-hydroxylacyl-ACP dehydratase